jgi:hypothetical protein
MAFKPIHNFLPRKNKRDQEHTATFITPNFKVGHPNRYLPQNDPLVKFGKNGEKTTASQIGLGSTLINQFKGK